MGDLLLTGLSNKPGATELILAQGQVPTGYKLMDGMDLGNADFDRAYSGARGTQGAVLASTEAVNRGVAFPLLIEGTSTDNLAARISTLHTLTDEFRRFGGKVKWRPKGASQYQYFIVLDGQLTVEETGVLMHKLTRVRATLSLVCKPYLEGECMDVLDDFTTDRLGEYTFDAGARSDVTVLSGELDAVSTTAVRAIHTATGYPLGDHQVTVKACPGATISGFKAGVVLKRIDPQNYLEVYVDDNGVNSRLRIDKVVSGSATNLSSTNLGARVIDSTYFWVRGRIEGNVVYAEHFLASVLPGPTSTPTTSASYTLTTGEAAQFGGYTGTGAATGQAGWTWTPTHTGAKLDDFQVEPYVYANAAMPTEFSLRGRIPGDVPALTDVHVTATSTTGTPAWAMIGWWERPRTYNCVWNGGAEYKPLSSATGWSNAAVTNINGASTSVDDVTTVAKFGLTSVEIVCPATANTGASFRIYRRFKRGVTYTAEAWIQSAAGTTNTYIRLGNGAANDKADSSNTVLSPTFQRITAAWTPSADRDDAHVAINIAAATGTTLRVDGVMVYEGTVAPTRQADGMGRYPPVGILEAETTLPFATMVITGSSTYRSDFAIVAGGSGASASAFFVDPSLLVPDNERNEEVTVGVWARVFIPDAVTSLTMVVRAGSATDNTDPRYTNEYGSAGKAIVLPSSTDVFRFVYLGSLVLSTLGPCQLNVTLTAGAAAGTAIDYLLLMPTRATALSPSGKALDTTFPMFIQTDGRRKVIKSDLTGILDAPSLPTVPSPTSGLGGSFIEFPAADVDALVKLSHLVPDDPTSNTDTEDEATTGTVHFSITPRFQFARSQ